MNEPAQLLAFLQIAFPDAKRTKLKQYLKFRCVSVNGRTATRHDHPLAPGDEVRVDLDRKARHAAALPLGVSVIYEDDDFIVIHKPVGMLSVATASEREKTAFHAVDVYLSQGPARLKRRAHVVHRLDQHTSGLLLFAKTEAARAFFLDNWRRVEKRYLAIVEGTPDPPEGTLRSFLKEDKSMRVHVARTADEGEEAVTHYRVLKSDEHVALVECRLETGRKNQIRVQLAEIGHPIIGDLKYGRGADPFGRLALHAWRMRIPQPRTGEMIEVESRFPERLSRAVGGKE